VLGFHSLSERPLSSLKVLVAAAAGAIEGTTSFVFSQTGNLKGSGTLSGTNGFTFNQTGLLRGTGILTGTNGFTFNQTGLLRGTGALNGTNGFVFSQTGDLRGSGVLSGTNSFVFNQTGDLTSGGATSPITGTVAFNFSQTGDLKGSGILTGSNSIIFNQTGDLKGSGVLSANVSFIFNQSASIAASGLLQGLTSITFGQSGSFSSGALVGTSIITFGSTGTLSGTLTIFPFTGSDLIGAHEYFPWHNKESLTGYFNKSGHGRKGYFPTDIERQDVLVRKRQAIENPTTIQELDWDVYNFFDVTLNNDVTFVFSNPRDNSDFVILLTKDSNSNVRNITWPASLAWPDGNSFTTMSVASETKLIRISYFGGRYRATLY
jgi:hypothetical protein